MKGILSDKKGIAITLVASLVVGLFGGVQSARIADAAKNERNLSGLHRAVSSEVIRHVAKTAGEGESAYAYYDDFSSYETSDDLKKVATASSGSSLELQDDIQYGGYMKHTLQEKANRSLLMNFDKDKVAGLDDYTVEIDVALKTGTEAGAQSEFVVTDTNFADTVADSQVSNNYIFKLGTGVQITSTSKVSRKRNRAAGKTWYINNSLDAANQVSLSDGTWVTVKLEVKTDSVTFAKTLDWEIIRRGTAVTLAKNKTSVSLNKATTTGMLKGIYALTGNGGETLVDNIRVSRYSETKWDATQYIYGESVSLGNDATTAKSIQWYRTDDKNSDGVKIDGATGKTYTPGQKDAGNYIYAILDNKTRIFFENRVKGIDIRISGVTIAKKEYDTTTAVDSKLVKLTFTEVASGNELGTNIPAYDTSNLAFDSPEVGKHTVSGKIILTGEWADCYELINGGRIRVADCEIVKGTPPYEQPPVIIAVTGQTLADIQKFLPRGFAWDAPTTSVGAVGENKKFQATYTPDDLNNYNKVTVDVTVHVADASTGQPTSVPTVNNPTATPSGSPSASASVRPSASASVRPSASPSIRPSASPSFRPSASPSFRPSASPSIRPSASPTIRPTATPRRTATPRPTKTPVPDDPYYPDDPDDPDDPYVEPLPEVDAAELTKNKLGLNKKIRLTWEGKTLCVSWGTVSGVEGYDVYAAVVGDDFTNDTIAKSLEGDEEDSINVKKIDGDSPLDKDMYYKVKVRAYRMIDDRKQGIGSSLTMYIAARKDSYYTNVKKIKLKKSSYSLKKGKTATIKPTLVKVAKSKTLLKTPGTRIRYVSSNTAVARVNENGKIKAVGKGSCTVYAIALNGVRKKISVKVK